MVKRTAFVLFVCGLFLAFGIASIFFSLKNKNQPARQIERQAQNSRVLSEASNSSLGKSVILEEAKVARVIDGDTIELENGQRVRYIGIDTPETVDPRKPVQCFGREASSKNKELVEGETVRLEKDVSQTDKYGRLLRYVFVNDVFVNDYLVVEGFAYASTFPPDIKYQNKFLKSERQAQLDNKGLWSSCGVDSQQVQQSPTDCIIKGNITSQGEKIYHLPGQKYYDKTVIDTARGEKWFCTEVEATDAGWRKSKL